VQRSESRGINETDQRSGRRAADRTTSAESGRLVMRTIILTALASCLLCAQTTPPAAGNRTAAVVAGEKAAIAVLNFRQGDAASLARARADFTIDGWKDFIKHLEGFLDEKGAPMFSSSFVALHHAAVLDEKDGAIHLRIPGTLTQKSSLGRTTYRAAIDVYIVPNQDPVKPVVIRHLEQITCARASTACQ
jgi:hypothetical protein